MAKLRQCCFLIVQTVFFTTFFLKIQASRGCGRWLETSRGECLMLYRWPEKTWHDARLACQSMGADLVTIRDEIKSNLIKSEKSNH
ncbi:hypothetical protein PoB_002794700 [Plakobranchus ocellatus]|uniref:C-type lectin domain-containing protein n=1 Tax=Plakobranchus ocellatus TaxID=259542 RepID=A0AAV4A3J4_9GAST|nr:hypothetical protein PoB_002794700 [Plakobranchus ocellatus]